MCQVTSNVFSPFLAMRSIEERDDNFRLKHTTLSDLLWLLPRLTKSLCALNYAHLTSSSQHLVIIYV